VCLPKKKLVTHAKQLTACSHNTSCILKALRRGSLSEYFWKEIKENVDTLPILSDFRGDAVFKL
jgi:3-polyprenyl-4-hydroxybenzoate decarboxylase